MLVSWFVFLRDNCFFPWLSVCSQSQASQFGLRHSLRGPQFCPHSIVLCYPGFFLRLVLSDSHHQEVLSLRLARHRDGPDYVTNIVTCGPRIVTSGGKRWGKNQAVGVTVSSQICKPRSQAHMRRPSWDQSLCRGALPSLRQEVSLGILECWDFSLCECGGRGNILFLYCFFSKGLT